MGLATAWRRALGALVCLGALAQPVATGARAAETPAEPAQPAPAGPRPFELYRGLEPRRHFSTSRVDAARSRHVFEPVLQGDVVHHAFRIPNPRPEPLAIRNLRLCSGCILEGWSRTIAPGGEGRIALVITTDWLGGGGIDGVITAETDAADLPRIEIEVLLAVREFAALRPYRVWLQGPPAPPLVETCLVVPNEAYPFSITGIKARKGVWFSHSWREVERDGRRAYEIRIENTRTKPGPYQDVLFVQTDHPERPEFKIRIEGRIEE